MERPSQGILRMKRRGFTLAEMMTVMAIVGMLSTISLSQVGRASRLHRETLLRTRLEVVRGALDRVYADTGLMPRTLDALTTHVPPVDGFVEEPNGSHTRVRTMIASTWRGPYLNEIPLDPITQSAFVYRPWAGRDQMVKVGSTSPFPGSDGVPYSQW